MRMIVFVGPTIAPGEAAAHLDATFLPPAAQGDVYRAAKERPFAIGIVDGMFERVPAVWHKEVLWALTQGIHVFGAASMGALRAAELAPFGMVGIGRIYDAFRSGELEDDDAVAVAHGDATTGFRATSEALVNIRATLAAALRSDTMSAPTCAELERIARADFYPDRSYPRLLRVAAERGLPTREVDAFRAFLPTGRVDQKRADTIDLFRAMEECRRRGDRPARPRFAFSRTDAWQQCVEGAAPPDAADGRPACAGLAE